MKRKWVVRRLRQPGNISGSNDDDLPSDADGFRLALAHRIEAFVRSRTDGDVPERDQQDRKSVV